jgi:hypothetical protein
LTRLRAEAVLLSASSDNPSAGEGPAIHATATSANASTGILLLQLSMDHWIKSRGDGF